MELVVKLPSIQIRVSTGIAARPSRRLPFIAKSNSHACIFDYAHARNRGPAVAQGTKIPQISARQHSYTPQSIDQLGTLSKNFKFEYDGAYGNNGLSQSYTGPPPLDRAMAPALRSTRATPTRKSTRWWRPIPTSAWAGPEPLPASSRTTTTQHQPGHLPGAILHRGPHQPRRRLIPHLVPMATSAPSPPAQIPATNSPACALGKSRHR